MRNWVKAASLCLLAAFALATCGCGGEKEKTSRRSSVKKMEQKTQTIKEFETTPTAAPAETLENEMTGGEYLTKPFDPTVKKLPPGFIGCDTSEVFHALLKAVSGDEWNQGEYEKKPIMRNERAICLRSWARKRCWEILRFRRRWRLLSVPPICRMKKVYRWKLFTTSIRKR